MLFDDLGLLRIATSTMEFIAANFIVKDFENLVGNFIDQILIAKLKYWDAFWNIDSTKRIQQIHENLMKKLMVVISDNVIIMEFTLITSFNYLQSLSNFRMEQNVQNIIRKSQEGIADKLIIFLRNVRRSDMHFNHEHFAVLLKRFFSSDGITEIIKYALYFSFTST